MCSRNRQHRMAESVRDAVVESTTVSLRSRGQSLFGRPCLPVGHKAYRAITHDVRSPIAARARARCRWLAASARMFQNIPAKITKPPTNTQISSGSKKKAHPTGAISGTRKKSSGTTRVASPAGRHCSGNSATTCHQCQCQAPPEYPTNQV